MLNLEIFLELVRHVDQELIFNEDLPLWKWKLKSDLSVFYPIGKILLDSRTLIRVFTV